MLQRNGKLLSQGVAFVLLPHAADLGADPGYLAAGGGAWVQELLNMVVSGLGWHAIYLVAQGRRRTAGDLAS